MAQVNEWATSDERPPPTSPPRRKRLRDSLLQDSRREDVSEGSSPEERRRRAPNRRKSLVVPVFRAADIGREPGVIPLPLRRVPRHEMDDCFYIDVADKFKKLSARSQIRLKREIVNLIFDSELMELDEAQPQPSASNGSSK